MVQTGDWPLFITAKSATIKVLNRVLLHLRDYEFGAGDGLEERFTVLTSRTPPSMPPPAAIVPLSDFPTPNQFESASLSDINIFMARNHRSLRSAEISAKLYVVLDDAGVNTDTSIVVSGDTRLRSGAVQTNSWRAVRTPYTQAWITMANLDVGNMDFEGFVDQNAGVQDDGTYRWIEAEPHPDPNVEKMYEETRKEVERKRERPLSKAREHGWID